MCRSRRITSAANSADEGCNDRYGHEQKAATQGAYEAALRDLQKKKIDGNEFIQLRADIERLTPLRTQKTTLSQKLKDLEQKRRNELKTWEEIKRERFQKLEQAAKKVSRQLPDRLRVKVSYGADRTELYDLLKRKPGGRIAETITALTASDQLSLSALAAASREGGEALTKRLRFPPARPSVSPALELPLMIEALDLPHMTEIELHVGPDNATPEWRKLDELSTGQKATALLYLLLLNANAPLVLDQPEDNLDNRFISEGVVPKIRSESGGGNSSSRRTTQTFLCWATPQKQKTSWRTKWDSNSRFGQRILAF